MRRQQRPRQADVARLAGVSPAIVSLVVNGRVDGNVRISAETQGRVREAVRRLGYVPNPVARSLAGGRNHLLGVFTYEPVFPLQQQNFYYPFLVGIEEEAEAQGYDLVLFTRANGAGGRRVIYQGGVNHLQLADGAVLLGTNEDREELTRLLRDGFPFVFVGRREVSGGEVSYAAADYAGATVDLVSRLVEQGHRRIAHIRLPGDNESAQDREAGYRLAHERFGLPLDERAIHHGGPEDITPELVGCSLAGGITAFVVADTRLAARLLEVARLLGKEAPRDFSLATQGDTAGDAEAIPGVTTFAIPRREMGAAAVRLLVERLARPADPGPRRITLPCAFVPGRTVGEAPRTAWAEAS